ncbi:MAG: glucans biosynthesis glucosyltransferase MdoH [Hyphomicrobiales bacterium]|nr:glucans biosynthesis glucosyltransferase MdoH [Hyphomicrobiales bacterium]
MKQPHSFKAVYLRRLLAVLFSLSMSFAATQLFIRFADEGGFSYLDIFRCALIAVSTAWLAWGATLSLFGLLYSAEKTPRLPDDKPLDGRTAILIPVYNEDPASTFSRVAAMDESLAQVRVADKFHFAILSDTTSEEIAEQEARWFARLITERRGEGRLFYRRRTANIGKKAGNIEDFVRRSGGAYEYALILDADSLMEGETILEMARRMEADPSLGLLQTLPMIIYARSFFGRAMQFSASYFSPIFARGVAMLQGYEGPFWGHNAIVRTTAFAESCGLPQLSGKPPFGGHILSHDYVEAALLARAGWRVRLDPDLTASYEEGPENLIEHAQRDRRWCQGNLQHGRLLLAPKLRLWSRFVFAQGIMAYVASPVWLIFLVTSIAAPFFTPPPNYFPEPHFPFPIFPANETIMAVLLVLGISCLLVLPKLLIVLHGAFTGANVKFGGTWRALASTLVEVLFSSLIAPLMLWFQSRAVLQVLLGADGGWPATNRDDGQLSLQETWIASRWIVLAGLATLAFAVWAAHSMLIWLIPIAGPMIFSPWLISASSRQAQAGFRGYLFATPSEFAPSPIVGERERVLDVWGALSSEPTPVDGADLDGAQATRDARIHVEA